MLMTIFQAVHQSWKDSAFFCWFGIMTTPPWPFCDWTPRAKGSFSLLDGRIWWKSMYSSCHIWDFILSVKCKSIGTTLEVKVEVVPVTMDAVDAITLSTANDTAALAISSLVAFASTAGSSGPLSPSPTASAPWLAWLCSPPPWCSDVPWW